VTTYIISVQEYSEKAGRMYGHPYTWPVKEKYRGRLPSDEDSFHTWIYGILKAKGYPQGARVKIVRPQAEDERRGFHLVFLGYVSPDFVTVERRSSRDFGESKSIPHLPWSRQPYWQSDPRRDRRGGRFHKHG